MKEVAFVKRFITVLAVMAIMAAMVAASAMPAFAANPEHSSCIGQQATTNNEFGKQFGAHGFGGRFVIADYAHNGFVKGLASDCQSRPNP
jgi:hypothetical protein